MKIGGIVLQFIGALLALYGFLKSGAAEYSDTLNMGLLNDKTNLVLLGGFIMVIGAIYTVSTAYPLQPQPAEEDKA